MNIKILLRTHSGVVVKSNTVCSDAARVRIQPNTNITLNLYNIKPLLRSIPRCSFSAVQSRPINIHVCSMWQMLRVYGVRGNLVESSAEIFCIDSRACIRVGNDLSVSG